MRYAILVVAALFMVSIFPGSAGAVGSGKSVTWAGGGKGKVMFDGKAHATKGLACKACHPALFKMKKGAKMTMAEMDKGQFCGACHNGKDAFGTADPAKCGECHKAGK